jgi:hypothetical protein
MESLKVRKVVRSVQPLSSQLGDSQCGCLSLAGG